MKVVLFNGSRREKGCTYTLLSLVAGVEQPVAEKKIFTNFIR
jgi:multimeric flavodoxin WrbA